MYNVHMQEKNGINLEQAFQMLSEKDDVIKEKDSAIKILAEENEILRARLELLLHDRYGKKSEKLPDEIFPVADEPEATEAEIAEIQAAEQEITVAGHTRKQPKRKPLSASFAREIVVHDIPVEQQICDSCKGGLHCIGEEVSEKLDYVPAQIKVIQNIRKKYGCRGCEMGITIAPPPPVNRALN